MKFLVEGTENYDAQKPESRKVSEGSLTLAVAILTAVLSITGLGFGLYDSTQLIKFSRQANFQLRTGERETRASSRCWIRNSPKRIFSMSG